MKTVNYKLVNRVNPMQPMDDLKKGPVPVFKGEADMEEVCSLVSQRSMLCDSDLVGVIQALITNATIFLLNSRAVQLGDMGYLTGALKTEQCEDPDKYTSAMIRKMRIVFIPSPKTRSILRQVNFRQVNEESRSHL